MNTMRYLDGTVMARVVLTVGAVLALPCPAWATQAFQESAGQVVMQAENYDNKIARNSKDWVKETSISGASGGAYMTSLPNTGTSINTGYVTTSPELVYNVQVTTTGTYYVWVRGIGPDANSDSLHAGIDGTGPVSADRIKGFTTSWVWSRATMDSVPATLVISTPGLHTVHLWMREDGFRVDKILLRTSSSSTAPTGTGPAESPRITIGPPPDTTPPTGSIIINGGAAATNTLAVTLTLSATDNSGTVAQMQFSNDGASYSPAEAYATTKPWTLPSGDGTKTVSVKFFDAAGNSSTPASDTIALDTIAPQISITSPQDGAVITAP